MPQHVLLQNLVPLLSYIYIFLFHGATAHGGPESPHYRGLTNIIIHSTVVSNPLERGSVRRRDLYLTTHNTHKRHISIRRRDSNPQPQELSGRRPTTYTTWIGLVLIPAYCFFVGAKFQIAVRPHGKKNSALTGRIFMKFDI